jgi:hypothetical protein
MRASCRPGRLWWIACAIATAVPAWAADDAPSLFASSEVRTVEVPSNGTPGPARLGRIDVGVLLMNRIRLDLPDGRSFVARRAATAASDSVHTVWSGSIDGVAGSAVSLTRQRDTVVGVVYVGRETYEIVPFWTGEVLLYGVGSECRPPYADLTASRGPDGTGARLAKRGSAAERHDAATRRVVAYYTPASRVRWSDYGGIEARIEAALAALNAQAANEPRWQLDRLREVDYAESGDARAAMRWLQNYLAGAGAEVSAPSGTADASAVLLITEDNNLCGVAARADAGQARSAELHAIYSSCLTDPSLAAQLNGHNSRAGRDALAEDPSVRWTR